ncbi:MAG TPA: MarR family transcriptional regulator [Candidatus Limnocylindria bacterium]|nr:MarR family transcriptional regulator [Candidatus Limnocylindria bacterium]
MSVTPLRAERHEAPEPDSERREQRERRARRVVDSLEASLVATIGPVFRHLLAHARRRPAWRTLTYQQYNVMRIVVSHGPTSQADIARRLLVSAPVVTRLASALVDANLMERHSDPRDKRAVLLALTAQGRRRVTAMRRDLLAAASELVEPLPEDRRASVKAALEELQVLLPERPHTGER